MTKQQKIAWITGASSGLGAATALRLVKEGWVIAATARSADKIEVLIHHVEIFGGGGRIVNYPGDVTDAGQMQEIVARIEAELGPIDLALLNAGTYLPDTVETFAAAHLQTQYETNVIGTAHCLEPVLKLFRARNKGHIAIVSSVAGYRGLPRSLSYGSSKAALINLAEALAIELRGSKIKVQVVCPGFIKTPLTDKNDFYMPMLMDVDKAAEELVRGLNGGFFEISFPWIFSLLTKLVDLLPDRLYIWTIGKIKEKQWSMKNEQDRGSDSDSASADQSGDGPAKAA
ncbi:MAG: SDR family NAD(P)-dependent oxidoreductase [Alphaproteobacteria bacterium]|nr:SDR family NAD(P)-dependent oxidoreductase [Alphaproteobacteria bacterium]